MTKRSALALLLPSWSKLTILLWVSRFLFFCAFLTTRLPISWFLGKYHSENEMFRTLFNKTAVFTVVELYWGESNIDSRHPLINTWYALFLLLRPPKTACYTCQLFLRYKSEIFILGVLGFLKTKRSFPKIPEEVQRLPKTSDVFRRHAKSAEGEVFFNQAWEIGPQPWAGVRSKFSTRRRESWQV